MTAEEIAAITHGHNVKLKARLDAALARVQELEAALNGCANIAHEAWNSPSTIRPAFERIEEIARAALAKGKT